MGSGIAQVALTHKLSVVMVDAKKQALERGTAAIQSGLGKLVEKSVLDEHQAAAALARLQTADSLQVGA